MITNKELGVRGFDDLTKDEFTEAIEVANNRKTTGNDGVHMELLKYDGHYPSILGHTCTKLLHLPNVCWITGKIP